LDGLTRADPVEMLGEPDVEKPGDKGTRWFLGRISKGPFDETLRWFFPWRRPPPADTVAFRLPPARR
jgi:hypothetical protein